MIYEPQSSINRKHLQNFHMRLLGTVLEKTITSVTPRYIADFATPLVLCWKTKSLTPTKLIGWVGLASQLQCAQVVLTYPNLVYFTLPLQRTEILSIYFDYKLRIYLLATTTDMLCKILFLSTKWLLLSTAWFFLLQFDTQKMNSIYHLTGLDKSNSQQCSFTYLFYIICSLTYFHIKIFVRVQPEIYYLHFSWKKYFES